MNLINKNLIIFYLSDVYPKICPLSNKRNEVAQSNLKISHRSLCARICQFFCPWPTTVNCLYFHVLYLR